MTHPSQRSIISRSRQAAGRLGAALGVALVSASLVSASLVAAAERGPAIVADEFVYTTAPFASCHASTIVETRAGQLIAAWFGGSAEGRADVGIWVSRRVADAWTPPVEVATGEQTGGQRLPCWNPVLFQPRSGPLLLFYKVGPSPSTWWGMLRTSDDNGQSWSAARRLPEGILGPINKPIELADGELLCPSSDETNQRPSKWRVHFERSGDQGQTWRRTEPLNDGLTWAAIQPSLLRLGGERLLALGRSRQGTLFQIASNDLGQTWGPMSSAGLPNPNSGTDAVTLGDSRHLLVYNHAASGRSPLNLAVSRDGSTWQAALVLEDGAGEFSYPAVVQTADGLAHITYTWKRQRIKHLVVDPAQLAPRDFQNGRWPQ